MGTQDLIVMTIGVTADHRAIRALGILEMPMDGDIFYMVVD